MNPALESPSAPVRSLIDPRVLMSIRNLELRARVVVQGFWSGLHRTPCAKSNCYPRGVFVVPKGVLPDGSHVFG